MIPKTIHYCWFGGNPKPELIEKCIASWHKFCPDYEIIEWNESNYDVNAHEYTKKAYADKKWAFVSDVARLEVLYRYGGIYLDTDVELLVPSALDFCLDYKNTFSFENARCIASGLILSGERNDELFDKFLRAYYLSDNIGKYNTNTVMNKAIFVQEFPQLKWNGNDQIINGVLFIGCEHYGKLMKHYGTRSWLEDFPDYKLKKVPKLILRLRNPLIFEKLEKSKVGLKIEPIYTFIVYDLFDLGALVFVKRALIKIKKK